MAKQNQKKNDAPLELKPFELFPFSNPKIPYIILGLIAFIFYINTIYNEFALDDGIVIHKNEYVMEGISGIDSIMKRDAYHSFYKQMNAKAQLAGGRYRPLSIVSFAIEQEFIGKYPDGKLPPAECWDDNGNHKGDPEEDINKDGLWNDNDCLTKGCMTRHLNNVLFYVLSVLLIYLLFRNHMFPQFPDMAFVAALLFCIHPIHTEVVANMKSRDEIFSMIFMMLTLINVFKYNETRQTKYIWWTALNFFLALLSKEYALMFIFVIPLTIYLFDKDKISIQKHGKLLAVVLGTFVIYMMIRFSIVAAKKMVPDTEILNNPYLLAKKDQIIGTKIYVWLKYLILLFFPVVLSSDYSYNSIPYRHLTSPETLLSLAIYIFLAWYTIKLFRKKHPAAWGMIFFFSNFLMICNLLFDIGATMGERLIFHSSLGWAVCMAWIGTEEGRKYFKSKEMHRNVLIGFLVILTIGCGYRTITRNAVWKNDITLFTHDVDIMPNSVLCLGNAGARWIDLSERPENKAHEKEYLNKAIGYLNHALELHPKYVNGYLNLGLAYFKFPDYNKAEEIWGKAYQLYPSNPYLGMYYRVLSNVYVNQAFADAKAGKTNYAAYWFERASRIYPQDPEIWYNLGGAAFSMGDFPKAKMAFEQCLQRKPDHANAKNGLGNIPPGTPAYVAPGGAVPVPATPGPVNQMPVK
ncbi:MAG: tetratricopeptide repeat protein [Bacteroidia bacterium]